MEAKRKKFGMELLPDLHRRMKQWSLDTGTPLWRITQDAVESYFKHQREAAGGYKPQHREQHELLEFILDQGSADDRNWISGNLKNFVEAIQARTSRKLKTGS